MLETKFETNRYATKAIIGNWLTVKPHIAGNENVDDNLDKVENALDLVDVYDN